MRTTLSLMRLQPVAIREARDSGHAERVRNTRGVHAAHLTGQC